MGSLLIRNDSLRRLLGATGLAVWALVVLNANGREIGSYDSQPAKYTARELAARGTFALDAVVARHPTLGERPGFGRSLDGHIRSSYPVLPAIIAAAPAWVLASLGALDLDGPMAPSIIAKLAASLLVALAIAFAFLIASQWASMRVAAVVALGYGLGTNVWLAGQTLGGHETAAFGLTAALVFLASPGPAVAGWRAWVAMGMLAVAGASRWQIAPTIAVMALSLVVRSRFRQWPALAVLAGASGLVIACNLAWFGHVLGAVPQLEALHSSVHANSGSFAPPWSGGLGLLFSPSRGIVIFSPIVLVCLAGLGPVFREGWRGPLAWCLAAACVQFALYACYSVWWGGHSYGPRYILDALPPLIPIAAAGVQALVRGRLRRGLAVGALCWSVLLAATGAFSYPAEGWNSEPDEVDTHHERLWDWRDPQFVRCWKTGLSPQNFALFRAGASSPPAQRTR